MVMSPAMTMEIGMISFRAEMDAATSTSRASSVA